MQDVAAILNVNIGFLFQKQAQFEAGLAGSEGSDPALAEYLRQTRAWSQPLLDCRNAVEHDGWILPRIAHRRADTGVTAAEPAISGEPASAFVTLIFDRLTCFVEGVTAHCLKRQMPAGITITELAIAGFPAESPERFRVTLASGGMPPWTIAFHASSFDGS